jgi:hypothetical protein
MRRVMLLIWILLLGATLPTAEAEHMDACGKIQRLGGCLLFRPYAGAPTGDYFLPDTTQLVVDSEWRIVGSYSRYNRLCGSFLSEYTLDSIRVSPCVPETLGCGVLWDFNPEYHCYAWTGLGDPGNTILVGGFGGFSLGDTVFAAGIRENCIDICICGCGCLLHPTFRACGDTLTPVQRMSWGRLKALYRE